MQMEPELTLERAVTLARQSECVKTQQPTVRGELLQESTIEGVKAQGSKQGITDFQVHRVTTHLLKEQRNRVVGVEGQVLTAKLSVQRENALATSAANEALAIISMVESIMTLLLRNSHNSSKA